MKNEFEGKKQWPTSLAALVTFVSVLMLWGVWAGWGAPGVMKLLCPTEDACSRLGQVGDLFGGVNALFAGLAFAGLLMSIELTRRAASEEHRRAHDKEVFEQLCKCYEWAFMALKGKSLASGPPLADRLAWLNAARHIVRASKLAKEIGTPTFRMLQQENEEYWRFRFYELLNHPSLGRAEYYSVPHPEENELEHNIYLPSAVIIANFLTWNERDPIEDVDLHAAIESPGFSSSAVGRGVERYMVRLHPRFTDEHLRYREKLKQQS